MKIIKDCWSSLGVSECQYGAHTFDGANAMIYVNHWLAAFDGLDQIFVRKNSEGFVGHCLLVFNGVKKFNFTVTHYIQGVGKIVWCDPIKFFYSGSDQDSIATYEMEGSLHGFPSSVHALIEAREFELHVWEENEPARQA